MRALVAMPLDDCIKQTHMRWSIRIVSTLQYSMESEEKVEQDKIH